MSGKEAKLEDPIKHHYLPVFYLSRWCVEDGRLCQFSKPYKNIVVPERKHPEATGYQPRLYEQKGGVPENAQWIEREFMQLVDTKASEALTKLEEAPEQFPEKMYLDWSRFLLSIEMRTPHSIGNLKTAVKTDWLKEIPGLKDRAALELGEHGRDYIQKIFDNDPEFTNRHALSLLTKLIEHKGIREKIHGMQWLIKTVKPPFEFLTSDVPLVMTVLLSEENAYMILPLGPQRLFIAAKEITTAKIFEAMDHEHLTTQINMIVAGRAQTFVYAKDDKMLPFVRKHMGTRQTPGLIERMARMHVNHVKVG